MKWFSLLPVLLVLPFAGPSMAAPPKTSSQDNTWLVGAHQDNLAEIQSGELAERSGHSEAVRNAGHMLATDHQKLDAKLKPVAKQLGVKLPKQPNLQQRNQMKHLKTLSGMQFDTIWTHDEADGHVKAIEQTEGEIEHGSDPQVQQLAQSALPVLKKHLQVLQQAAVKIKGSKNTG